MCVCVCTAISILVHTGQLATCALRIKKKKCSTLYQGAFYCTHISPAVMNVRNSKELLSLYERKRSAVGRATTQNTQLHPS